MRDGVTVQHHLWLAEHIHSLIPAYPGEIYQGHWDMVYWRWLRGDKKYDDVFHDHQAKYFIPFISSEGRKVSTM